MLHHMARKLLANRKMGGDNPLEVLVKGRWWSTNFSADFPEGGA